MAPKRSFATTAASTGDGTDQSLSRTPAGPATGHDDQYTLGVVHTVHVTSDQPFTPRKIDAVKKSLGLDDRGCAPDDGVGTARIRVVQSSVEVIEGSSAKSTSPSPPPSPPRSQSASSGGLGKRGQKPQKLPKRILFYHAYDPYYGFTNFSPDPVEYEGKVYPTSEHLFQSLKFLEHRPELAEHIRTCSTRPRVVFDETHRFNPEVRRDWLSVRIEMMDKVLWHKFTQNEHLKQELLSTGDAELVEDSDKDAFWGVGPDGKGENQLGKALQRLRTRLRSEIQTKPSQHR